jgi:hypothetical protein
MRVDALDTASNQRLAEPELESALEAEVLLLLLGLLLLRLLIELAPACVYFAYADVRQHARDAALAAVVR